MMVMMIGLMQISISGEGGDEQDCLFHGQLFIYSSFIQLAATTKHRGEDGANAWIVDQLGYTL